MFIFTTLYFLYIVLFISVYSISSLDIIPFDLCVFCLAGCPSEGIIIAISNQHMCTVTQLLYLTFLMCAQYSRELSEMPYYVCTCWQETGPREIKTDLVEMWA